MLFGRTGSCARLVTLSADSPTKQLFGVCERGKKHIKTALFPRGFQMKARKRVLTRRVSAGCWPPAAPGTRRWRSPRRSACGGCPGTAGCRAPRRQTPWPRRRPRPPAAARAPAATPGPPSPWRGQAGEPSRAEPLSAALLAGTCRGGDGRAWAQRRARDAGSGAAPQPLRARPRRPAGSRAGPPRSSRTPQAPPTSPGCRFTPAPTWSPRCGPRHGRAGSRRGPGELRDAAGTRSASANGRRGRPAAAVRGGRAVEEGRVLLA